MLEPGLLDEDELILTLDLKPGEHADALIAAEALIAWVGAVRAANLAMDPGSDVSVDLIGMEVGSLRIRAGLRFIEDKIIGPPADALTEFPRIKKLVVATVLGTPAGIAAAWVGAFTLPDATVKLSPAGRERLHHEQVRVQEVPAVRTSVQKFYKTVSRDPSVIGISIKEGDDSDALVTVPHSQFAERSGMWAVQEQANHERLRKEVWDVVVTHPAMKSAPMSWKFERDGLTFSARMADDSFLEAIREGTIPITIQEGVEMRVEIEWAEQLEGQIWEPQARTRKITRVLSPRPQRTSVRRPLTLD